MDIGRLVLAIFLLVVVVDPPESIAFFLTLGSKRSTAALRRIAFRAGAIATMVLLFFVLSGEALLMYIHVEMYSLRAVHLDVYVDQQCFTTEEEEEQYHCRECTRSKGDSAKRSCAALRAKGQEESDRCRRVDDYQQWDDCEYQRTKVHRMRAPCAPYLNPCLLVIYTSVADNSKASLNR